MISACALSVGMDIVHNYNDTEAWCWRSHPNDNPLSHLLRQSRVTSDILYPKTPRDQNVIVYIDIIQMHDTHFILQSAESVR